MVADARCVQDKKSFKEFNPGIHKSFRGSWSGYERDCLFHNPDGPAPRFVNCAWICGLDFDDDGRSACPVDIDGDGDLDLVCLSLQGLRLVENTAVEKKSFARVRLRAKATQALGLGAVVKVTAGGVTQQDYCRVTDGFLSQVPVELHFGLGSAGAIDAVEIDWPSGKKETFRGLPVNRLLEFTEGASAPVESALKSWPAESRPKVKPSFDVKLAAKAVDGAEGPLAKAGSPVVVNFWSPTCAPCREELPSLEATSAHFAGQVQFAGVSSEVTDLASVKETIAAFKLGYPQFLANDAVVKSFFGAGGEIITPSTFVFDASGRLQRIFQRRVEPAELSALLASLRDEGIAGADLERRGGWLLQQDRPAEAIPLLERAAGLLPGKPDVHYELGLSYARSGDREKAVASLRRAVELDAAHASARHNLAEVLRLSGFFDEAAEQYRETIRIMGDEYDSCWGLGDCLWRVGRNDEAIQFFDRAIPLDAHPVAALRSKGTLLARLGNREEAARLLRRVLQLVPGDPDAQAVLSQLQ